MNIIFQSGEFFSSPPSKTNTAIWISILTFVLGYIITNRMKRNSILVDAIEAKTYMLTATQNLIDALISRAKYYEEFYLQVKDPNNNSFNVKDTLGLHLANIDFLDRVKIYSSLITNQTGDIKAKTESLNEYFNWIEKLRYIIENNEDKVNGYFDITNETKDQMDSAIKSIMNLFIVEYKAEVKKGNFVKTANGVVVTDKLLNRIDSIIANWQKQKHFVNYHIKDQFLLEPLRKIIQEKQITDFTIELTNHVTHATDNYFNYSQNRNNLKNYLMIQKLNMLKAARKLTLHYNLLYSQNVKKAWFYYWPIETKYNPLKVNRN